MAPASLPAFSVSEGLSEEKANFSWNGGPADTSLSQTFTGWLNGDSTQWENKKQKDRLEKSTAVATQRSLGCTSRALTSDTPQQRARDGTTQGLSHMS